MRRVLKSFLLVGVLALVWAPAQASADGFFVPWAGANWANGDHPDAGRGAFGVSAGGMGAGIIGGEVDFGISPSFFGTKTDFGTNSVMSLMGNLIVGVPIGGTYGKGVRPFAVGGIGLLRSQADGGDLFTVSSHNNDLGWNAGAGVMGFFNQHVGLRGDVRYFRDIQNHDVSGPFYTNLHYWRASIGVAFR